MSTLYELANNYLDVLSRVPEDEDAAEDMANAVSELNDAIEVKAENIVKYIRNLQAESDQITEEIGKLEMKRRAKDNRIDWLRNYLAEQMKSVGLRELKAGIFDVKFRRNPPRVEVVQQSAIPQEYWIPQLPKLSLALIKEDLQKGMEVPGTALVNGESITIR